jgi:hypothetical protein
VEVSDKVKHPFAKDAEKSDEASSCQTYGRTTMLCALAISAVALDTANNITNRFIAYASVRWNVNQSARRVEVNRVPLTD